MTPSPRRAVLVAAAAAGAAVWEVQRRVDLRRVEADPEHAVLARPLEGRPVPVTSSDGTVLHAEVFGPDGAPTVVLVHGWTCALRFWTYQIQELSRDLRVVAYDLRGHGRSDAAAGGDYAMERFGDDLQAVLEACVPAGERAVVAGHSLGGMTLVAWAKDHPDEVRRRAAAVALVNTGMGDLISESLVLRTPQALSPVKALLGRALLSADAPMPKGTTPLSQRVVRYVALSPSASPARVAFCEDMVLGCRRDARAAAGATLSRLDLREGVAHLDVPAAVVASEHDRLTPPVHARRLAEALPQLVELVEIPEVGHMSPIEAPEVVNARLRALVDAHLPPESLAAAAGTPTACLEQGKGASSEA